MLPQITIDTDPRQIALAVCARLDIRPATGSTWDYDRAKFRIFQLLLPLNDELAALEVAAEYIGILKEIENV